MRRRIVLLSIILLASCAWCPEGPQGESRPYAPRAQAIPSSPTRARYQLQRYYQSCVFAAFAAVTSISEERLTNDFKASDIGSGISPKVHSIDPGLLVRWLNTQGYHFENALWHEHGTSFHGDWRAWVQNANVRGVVTSGGHAWVLLSADETTLTVWDPWSGRAVRLPYTGVTGIFLPVRIGLEDYDDYEPTLPAGNKVIVTSGGY